MNLWYDSSLCNFIWLLKSLMKASALLFNSSGLIDFSLLNDAVSLKVSDFLSSLFAQAAGSSFSSPSPSPSSSLMINNGSALLILAVHVSLFFSFMIALHVPSILSSDSGEPTSPASFSGDGKTESSVSSLSSVFSSFSLGV
ncbi:uncharacterized protein G2W53_034421 [Senna tora]|uniref:Uncharacterized protein n=1 Tax=Senna tora TaxID=362788 RepID=A0A834T0I0_9FABA|nr:uncharacterized protein G2W53_034421 [Senna tora]